MFRKLLILPLLFVVLFTACNQKPKVEYPQTKKGEVVDNYFGANIADPYRWLEENNSDETAAWVTSQNSVTNSYLSQIPFRSALQKRYEEIWNYEKYSTPYKKGKYIIYTKNDGLQEQSVYYIQEGLEGKAEVLLDPNKLSDDGSVSLGGIYFSKDQKYLAYGISRGGSDWREFYVMEISTRKVLEDHLQWIKFSGASWYKDGFYYSRYDEPKGEDKLKAKNEFQKLYYHKVGTSQSEDRLVYQDTKNPKRGFGASVTDDNNYLVINVWEGSSSFNRVYYKSLKKRNAKVVKLLDDRKGRFWFVENKGSDFYFQTDYNAPNFRVVKININKSKESNWKDLVSEQENKLEGISIFNDKIIASYLKDANTQIVVNDFNGNKINELELPGLGSVSGFSGSSKDDYTFYRFTSFTTPPTIYKYDIENNKSELFRKSNVKFDDQNFETKQVFYKSKDGTEVPLFIVYKKGLELDGTNPTLLYAYGGFNNAMKPSFRLSILPLLEAGGVYAMACLRGGSEYGEKWHKAGMLEKKQNVFDDFIAAGEYLIKENYTSSEKLAVFGGSNGGLLVGAVINQRPDLFKVAIPAVGVMDMLRFHKFTIGWAWVGEYGSSDNKDQFDFLYKYSPLHNIKENLNYPATLVTTADHDDRVFPAHSFKYISELQNKYKGDNPVLIRIETKVGHGAGMSTSKAIEYYSDLISFMLYNMDEDPKF